MTVIQQKLYSKYKSTKFDVRQIEGLEAFERELYETLSDSKAGIRDMCTHILSAGGKRIRPLLVLNSGMIFPGDPDKLINAAIAAELIHMASLVHDDIIDNSSMRRSKPSINKVWGNHFAVLCGDYLFAKAFGVLSHNRLMSSMDYMVEAIQEMCQGEILQAEGRYSHHIDVDAYYERISKKTAVFLACCCKSGAAAAGAEQKYIDILSEYGMNLGYAFQIIDDILDFCGDGSVMGKLPGSDLRQGVITLPVIFLLRHRLYKGWIKELIAKKDFSEKTIGDITIILKESGVIDECFEISQTHVMKAKKCLEMLPECKYTAFLYELTERLQARSN